MVWILMFVVLFAANIYFNPRLVWLVPLIAVLAALVCAPLWFDDVHIVRFGLAVLALGLLALSTMVALRRLRIIH